MFTSKSDEAQQKTPMTMSDMYYLVMKYYQDGELDEAKPLCLDIIERSKQLGRDSDEEQKRMVGSANYILGYMHYQNYVKTNNKDDLLAAVPYFFAASINAVIDANYWLAKIFFTQAENEVAAEKKQHHEKMARCQLANFVVESAACSRLFLNYDDLFSLCKLLAMCADKFDEKTACLSRDFITGIIQTDRVAFSQTKASFINSKRQDAPLETKTDLASLISQLSDLCETWRANVKVMKLLQKKILSVYDAADQNEKQTYKGKIKNLYTDLGVYYYAKYEENNSDKSFAKAMFYFKAKENLQNSRNKYWLMKLYAKKAETSQPVIAEKYKLMALKEALSLAKEDSAHLGLPSKHAMDLFHAVMIHYRSVANTLTMSSLMLQPLTSAEQLTSVSGRLLLSYAESILSKLTSADTRFVEGHFERANFLEHHAENNAHSRSAINTHYLMAILFGERSAVDRLIGFYERQSDDKVQRQMIDCLHGIKISLAKYEMYTESNVSRLHLLLSLLDVYHNKHNEITKESDKRICFPVVAFKVELATSLIYQPYIREQYNTNALRSAEDLIATLANIDNPHINDRLAELSEEIAKFKEIYDVVSNVRREGVTIEKLDEEVQADSIIAETYGRLRRLYDAALRYCDQDLLSDASLHCHDILEISQTLKLDNDNKFKEIIGGANYILGCFYFETYLNAENGDQLMTARSYFFASSLAGIPDSYYWLAKIFYAQLNDAESEEKKSQLAKLALLQLKNLATNFTGYRVFLAEEDLQELCQLYVLHEDEFDEPTKNVIKSFIARIVNSDYQSALFASSPTDYDDLDSLQEQVVIPRHGNSKDWLSYIEMKVDLLRKVISLYEEKDENDKIPYREFASRVYGELGEFNYYKYLKTKREPYFDIAESYLMPKENLFQLSNKYWLAKLYLLKSKRATEKGEKAEADRYYVRALAQLISIVDNKNENMSLTSDHTIDLALTLIEQLDEIKKLKCPVSSLECLTYADDLLGAILKIDTARVAVHLARARLFESHQEDTVRSRVYVTMHYFVAVILGSQDALDKLVSFFYRQPKNKSRDEIITHLDTLKANIAHQTMYSDSNILLINNIIVLLESYHSKRIEKRKTHLTNKTTVQLPVNAIRFFLARSLVQQPYTKGKYNGSLLKTAETMLNKLTVSPDQMMVEQCEQLKEMLDKYKTIYNIHYEAVVDNPLLEEPLPKTSATPIPLVASERIAKKIKGAAKLKQKKPSSKLIAKAARKPTSKVTNKGCGKPTTKVTSKAVSKPTIPPLVAQPTLYENKALPTVATEKSRPASVKKTRNNKSGGKLLSDFMANKPAPSDKSKGATRKTNDTVKKPIAVTDAIKTPSLPTPDTLQPVDLNRVGLHHVTLPSFVKDMLLTIEQFGFRACVRGSFVWLGLLNQDTNERDIDIFTDAPLDFIEHHFGKRNNKNGDIVRYYNYKNHNRQIDISHSENAANLVLEARKVDYTIRAICMDAREQIFDPTYFGIQHLLEKRVCSVTHYAKNFIDDPGRIITFLNVILELARLYPEFKVDQAFSGLDKRSKPLAHKKLAEFFYLLDDSKKITAGHIKAKIFSFLTNGQALALDILHETKLLSHLFPQIMVKDEKIYSWLRQQLIQQLLTYKDKPAHLWQAHIFDVFLAASLLSDIKDDNFMVELIHTVNTNAVLASVYLSSTVLDLEAIKTLVENKQISTRELKLEAQPYFPRMQRDLQKADQATLPSSFYNEPSAHAGRRLYGVFRDQAQPDKREIMTATMTDEIADHVLPDSASVDKQHEFIRNRSL